MNPLNHMAIIMDGNGRWGLKYKNSRNAGHKKGLKTVESVINFCLKKKIRYLTLFAFSTENWKRPSKEIKYLFLLLESFLKKKIHLLVKKKIKLLIIGNKKKISKNLCNLIKDSEDITKKNYNLQINLALNYGSKEEIVNSIKKIKRKNLLVTEKNITNNLYTSSIPDPEILIRTGNTKRLSNFLLWQLSYTEIFFEKKLWPDFTEMDLKRILTSYKKIKRNFGSI